MNKNNIIKSALFALFLMYKTAFGGSVFSKQKVNVGEELYRYTQNIMEVLKISPIKDLDLTHLDMSWVDNFDTDPEKTIFFVREFFKTNKAVKNKKTLLLVIKLLCKQIAISTNSWNFSDEDYNKQIGFDGGIPLGEFFGNYFELLREVGICVGINYLDACKQISRQNYITVCSPTINLNETLKTKLFNYMERFCEYRDIHTNSIEDLFIAESIHSIIYTIFSNFQSYPINKPCLKFLKTVLVKFYELLQDECEQDDCDEDKENLIKDISPVFYYEMYRICALYDIMAFGAFED